MAVISLVSGSVDPLPPSQGDTLQGVAKELEAVLNTGHYQFAYAAGSTEGVRGAMELIYRPLLSAYVEEAGPLAVPGDLVEQHWNREQINDFVRKLGFLDSEGAVGVRINHFLHLHQVGGGGGEGQLECSLGTTCECLYCAACLVTMVGLAGLYCRWHSGLCWPVDSIVRVDCDIMVILLFLVK